MNPARTLPNPEVMEEALREAERLSDEMMARLDALDERTQNLLALASAAVAGGFALTIWLIEQVCGAGFALPAMTTIATITALAALGYFVAAYVGLRPSYTYQLTPDIDWLVAEAQSPASTLDLHREAVLLAHRDAYKSHEGMIERALKSRSRGVRWLLVTAGILVVVGVVSLFGKIGAEWGITC